jgi:MscS family membrane protein
MNALHISLPGPAGQILLALVVPIVLWTLRHFLERILFRLLRHLTIRRYPQLQDVARSVLNAPTTLFILALVVWLEIRILDLDAHTRPFAESLTVSLLIMGIIAVGYSLVDILTYHPRHLKTLTGIQIGDRLLPFVRTIIKLLLLIVAAVIIVQQWGYDLSGLVAGLGLTSLALALAAQQTAANLFSFVTIISTRPFVVGDYIKTPLVEGTIEQVGLWATRLRQSDQAIVTMPNSKLTDSFILNWTHTRQRRIAMHFHLAGNTDMATIQRLLERLHQLLAGQEHVDPDSVSVHLSAIDDGKPQIEAQCTVRLIEWTDFLTIREDIYLAVLAIMQDMQITAV